MNRKILQKVMDLLNVGTPEKVMYAMGMIEALMESLPEENKVIMPPTLVPVMPKFINVDKPKENLSESDILGKQAEERIKNIKDIAL